MPESRAEIIPNFLRECQRQAEKPLRINGVPDKYMAMYATAMLEVLPTLPEAEQDLEWVIAAKNTVTPFSALAAYHSSLRVTQEPVMDDPTYPPETQEEWNELVQATLGDKERRINMISKMLMYDVGSDVETRIAGPKLVAQTWLKTQGIGVEEPISILNVGSSRNHGLALIEAVNTGEIHFPKVTISKSDSDPLSQATLDLLENQVNDLLDQPLEMSEGVGVDRWVLRDVEWSRFIEACRFYPSELHDPEKRARYQRLEQIRDRSPILKHIMGDFEKPDFIEKHHLTKQFDLVLFPTSLNQNHPTQQKIMFDNATQLGRAIAIQDFFIFSSKRSAQEHPLDQLTFVGPVSKPYMYTTVVYNPAEPEKGLQRFMTWNNGRCERFRPGKLLVDALLAKAA